MKKKPTKQQSIKTELGEDVGKLKEQIAELTLENIASAEKILIQRERIRQLEESGKLDKMLADNWSKENEPLRRNVQYLEGQLVLVKKNNDQLREANTQLAYDKKQFGMEHHTDSLNKYEEADLKNHDLKLTIQSMQHAIDKARSALILAADYTTSPWERRMTAKAVVALLEFQERPHAPEPKAFPDYDPPTVQLHHQSMVDLGYFTFSQFSAMESKLKPFLGKPIVINHLKWTIAGDEVNCWIHLTEKAATVSDGR